MKLIYMKSKSYSEYKTAKHGDIMEKKKEKNVNPHKRISNGFWFKQCADCAVDRL